jgi:hypothetical protein
MRQSKIRFAMLFLVFGLIIGALAGGTAMAVQQHMVNARGDLNAALNQLNLAQPDKAGHRVNAINLVNQAIEQVNLGIQAGA